MPVNRDVLRARISEIVFAVSELRRLTSKPFEQLSVDEKYAIRYNVIVLAEALVSLCMHVAVEEHARSPSSYREAVRFAAERLGVPCVKNLESIVGLRNLLIHRYWIIDDEKVYGSVRTNFKCVEELIGRVKSVFQL